MSDSFSTNNESQRVNSLPGIPIADVKLRVFKQASRQDESAVS